MSKDLNRKKAQPEAQSIEDVTTQMLNPEPMAEGKELKTQRVTFVVKPSVWKAYQDICTLKGLKPSQFISERFTEWVYEKAEENKEYLEAQRQIKQKARG